MDDLPEDTSRTPRFCREGNLASALTSAIEHRQTMAHSPLTCWSFITASFASTSCISASMSSPMAGEQEASRRMIPNPRWSLIKGGDHR